MELVHLASWAPQEQAYGGRLEWPPSCSQKSWQQKLFLLPLTTRQAVLCLTCLLPLVNVFYFIEFQKKYITQLWSVDENEDRFKTNLFFCALINGMTLIN